MPTQHTQQAEVGVSRLGWRLLGLVVALMVGMMVAPEAGAQGMSLASSPSGTVEVTYGAPREVTLDLSAQPDTGSPVMVTLVSTDPEVAQLKVGDAAPADRVTLEFTNTQWQGVPFTIAPVRDGETIIIQMMNTGTQPTFTFLNVHVRTVKQHGQIRLRSMVDQPWFPISPGVHGGWLMDHSMGEGQSVTYEVSLDADACATGPAEVHIRTSGRSTWKWSRDPHQLDIMQAGGVTHGASHTAGQYLWAIVSFAQGTCMTPKPVTITSFPDYEPWGATKAAYADLHHTLKQANGAPVSESGPTFGVWVVDRTIVYVMNAEIGDTYTDTIAWTKRVTTGTQQAKYDSDGNLFIDYQDNMSDILHGMPNPVFLFHYTPTRLSLNPPSGTLNYREYCIYIPLFEKLQAHRMSKHPGVLNIGNHSPQGSGPMPLKRITLEPVQYDISWRIGHYQRKGASGQERMKVGKFDAYAFSLPIRMQRYSAVVNRDGDCQAAPTSGGAGKWETVYAGGPAALSSDKSLQGSEVDVWRSDSANTDVAPFVIEDNDWGQFINVRIAPVWPYRERAGGVYEVYDPAGHRLGIRFAIAEIASAAGYDEIEITFAGR